MLIFTKHHLYHIDYVWIDQAAHYFEHEGKPSNCPLNRKNGYEMLYLINQMIILWDFTKIKSGVKMERIIREKLPKTIDTHQDAVLWIQMNWKDIEFKNNSKKHINTTTHNLDKIDLV